MALQLKTRAKTHQKQKIPSFTLILMDLIDFSLAFMPLFVFIIKKVRGAAVWAFSLPGCLDRQINLRMRIP